MRATRYVYFSLIVLALIVAFGVWNPLLKADHRGHGGTPTFVVDASWPKPLPAPVDSNGVAHRWVAGEVAGSCIDAQDNVFTVNRAWERGVTLNGVLQGNQSGAIVGQDASASSIPAPPVIEYDSEGNTVAGWGNPALIQSGPSYGGAAYWPHGAHGCFVDYQGNIWTAGNGDGVVQKYPHDGGGGVWLLQIGEKGVCDGPSNNSAIGGAAVFPTCGDAHDLNSSHTLLNEPADVTVDPSPDPVTGQPGDVYIADGYGNHRIVVFDANGNYLRQWGTKCSTIGPTCAPGTFGATGGGHPHCVVLGNDGLVYACDRPDSRIEVFDKLGNFVRQIPIEPPASASPGAQAAILLAGTRACDIDFWPNLDFLASKSPTSQKLIINVDLGNDNTWILDHSSGTMLGALGRCGIAPCPGHNAGEFSFGHTTAVDSHGNIYVAETIAGRRIQKFVRTDFEGDDKH